MFFAIPPVDARGHSLGTHILGTTNEIYIPKEGSGLVVPEPPKQYDNAEQGLQWDIAHQPCASPFRPTPLRSDKAPSARGRFQSSERPSHSGVYSEIFDGVGIVVPAKRPADDRSSFSEGRRREVVAEMHNRMYAWSQSKDIARAQHALRATRTD